MVLILNLSIPYNMALGAVATGNIKAQLAFFAAARIGINNLAVTITVFDVISVNKVINR